MKAEHKPVKAKRSYRSLDYWLNAGEVRVSSRHESDGLSFVRIEFDGELGRIPSLKNSKLPGRNFLNPDTVNRLKAMTLLFNGSVSPGPFKAFSEPVVGVLICGKRPVRFDTDNCAAAIKDWLEPQSKRNRGWGVGLVEDDSTVALFPMRGEQLGAASKQSVLILRRWRDVKQSFALWLRSDFES